ncbi:MAG TPA: diacylglycerol kinase family protein [Myxococcota bacterium]|nr:diacylglycerol kinase family protein [Myxococcota bacterium]HRY97384.1 diacylglycerol kinase family protein [Myxococcota bacterium]HSA23379.1 diacylglycerol kinase family protein [Myxococcota bacterium]
MPGIGVISNRNARLNKLYPKLKDRMAFVVGRGGEVASTGSLDDAQQAIEEFKRVGIDMLAISGGDGTAHRTIELLIKTYGQDPLPPVLLLPTGTQNMVPGSFGIRDSGVATLLLAQARYRHNLPMRCLRRNVLKVNEHHSFMFGLGIGPRFLQEYYRRGKTTPAGAASLLWEYGVDAARGGVVARGLTATIGIRARLDDGAEIEMQPHSVFASFIEELSLRFKLFPRAGWDEKLFEVLIVEGHPALVVKALPFLWVGSIRPLQGIKRHMVRRLELVLDHPEPYTLDGEVYEPTDRLVISAGPELRFVVPGLRLRPADKHLRHDRVGPWELRFLV